MRRSSLSVALTLFLLLLIVIPTQNSNAASIYLSSQWTRYIDGLRTLDHDVTVTNTATGQTSVYFEGYEHLTGINQDVDGFDVLSDGSLVFSSDFDISIGGATYQNVDLIRFNPFDNSSSLYFDGSPFIVGSGRGIDAVAIRPDGSFIFSTYDNCEIDGISYDRNDLINYDPLNGNFSMFLSEIDIFGHDITGVADTNITAVDFLNNGNIVFSSSAYSNTINGLEYDYDDLIELNTLTNEARLFLNGETIYGSDTNIDGVAIDAVPIPGAVWLLGSGLVGLVAVRRRNNSQGV